MKIEGDDVIFSTGTVKYANNGFIGLSPEGDVSEGYDGGFFSSDDFTPDLTPAECVELAEYMILEWQAFRENYKEIEGKQ